MTASKPRIMLITGASSGIGAATARAAVLRSLVARRYMLGLQRRPLASALTHRLDDGLIEDRERAVDQDGVAKEGIVLWKWRALVDADPVRQPDELRPHRLALDVRRPVRPP